MKKEKKNWKRFLSVTIPESQVATHDNQHPATTRANFLLFLPLKKFTAVVLMQKVFTLEIPR
jgi:hypothetical protein